MPLSWRVLRGGGGVGGGPLWFIVPFDVSGRAVNESGTLAVAVAPALNLGTGPRSRMGGFTASLMFLAPSAALGLGNSEASSPVARAILGGLALCSGSFCWREMLDMDDELEVLIWDSNSLTKVLVAGMGVSSVH